MSMIFHQKEPLLSENGFDKVDYRLFNPEGGKYLGICAGAYFASSRCEFEADRLKYRVVGDRDLAFTSAIAKGSVSSGFVYGLILILFMNKGRIAELKVLL
jgi:glutamine amidotransferase-like uncharacterized protein